MKRVVNLFGSLLPKGRHPIEDKDGKFLEVNGAEFQIIVDGKEVLVKADAIAKDAPGRQGGTICSQNSTA